MSNIGKKLDDKASLPTTINRGLSHKVEHTISKKDFHSKALKDKRGEPLENFLED